MFARFDPPSAPNYLTAVRDPSETAEWLDALESVFNMAGAKRAEFILAALDRKAKDLGIVPDVRPFGSYVNTIPLEKPSVLGDIYIETRITAIAGMRWPWSCAPIWRMATSAVMSQATPPPPRFSRSASIIFFRATNAAAMLYSSNLTQPRAFTLAPSSRAGSPRSS